MKEENQTYRDLRSLFRLFLASIFIIGSLNYIFSQMIEALDQKTKNLQLKKEIQQRINNSIISARKSFSQTLISKNGENIIYFKKNIDKELKSIKEYITVLKMGGSIDKDIYQDILYQPKQYTSQYDNFNKLSLNKLSTKLILLENNIKQLYKDIKSIHDYKNIYQNRNNIEKINSLFDDIEQNNSNLLIQTIYQLNRIKSEIKVKKERYTGYELLAIIFVISSLLYTSNLISKQILTNSQKLEESNKIAKDMAEKSKLANKAKSEFLANMSHEIRTPLNAILGFIDILKEKERDSEKLKYIQTIQSSSTTLLGIINDILDFSKIESGNLSIEEVNFNTEEELSTISDLFRAKASQKSISLTFNVDESIPKALISDPLRLKQVIANLLSNAIKFTPRNGRIELLMRYKNSKLHVSVKDNGIGIAKDKQKDIFKAFSQAESSTTRKYGGTGLGLAISSKLIKMLGGELKLESIEGKGSRFFFEIPIKEGVYKKERKADPNNYQKLTGKKILLVEDNKANQMFMSLILKKFGLIFDIACDGNEAVKMFKNNFYDLVLMDENMPNKNGIEATKEILEFEKIKREKHTPIVALTANALKGDRKRFLQAGMDEYLTKPLDKDRLFEVLNQLIIKQSNKELLV